MDYIYSCKSRLPTNGGLFGEKEQTQNKTKKIKAYLYQNFACSSSLHSKLLPSKQNSKKSHMFYFGLNQATALSNPSWVLSLYYESEHTEIIETIPLPSKKMGFLPVLKETASFALHI